ncbi:MAG: 4-alpha-glucanotransferase [Thermomicrobiales bacterium]|nr:4-alpha-glucanotransferase [Thermomicrobiales bacterium]
MPFARASGVLAHPTSFPGPHGVGDLGDAAFRFVDWLHESGQRHWQIMPLVPVGPGNSPYASVSAFAGNPLLISLPWLVGDGLLDAADLHDAPAFDSHHVAFAEAGAYKEAKLRRAYDRFRSGAALGLRDDHQAFLDRESAWVDDFALFMAAKAHFNQAGWTEWDESIALRDPAAKPGWQSRLSAESGYHGFVQFLFQRQWRELKRYANQRGVSIIGDIPIFVAHDSADVWGNREQFRLDDRGRPLVVAGVPPDYFSATGQLWGNPHYDWSRMAADGYRWWVERFRSLLELVDIVRIDHFRAFAAAWVVPAGDSTAANGRWERGPRRTLFDVVQAQLGDVPIIVEDLGLITDDVHTLRRELKLPGMAVLQFAFNGDPENAYLPHNYADPVVVYPGTHDNQTTVGWFHGLDDQTRRQVQTYLGRDGSDIAWDLIRLALSSTAELAIFSLQDALRLGDEARMNIPGVGEGNWAWRFTLDQLDAGVAHGLSLLTSAYGRTGERRDPASRDRDPFDYTAPNAAHPLHS